MRRIASWVAACAVLLACRRAQPEVDLAAQRFELRRSAFVGFERWTQRALLGADAFRSERALAEALFSRVRSDRDLVGAWVQGGEQPRLALAFPEGAELPAFGAGAVRVRDRELGTVEVLLGAACPTSASTSKPSEPRSCDVFARVEENARSGVRVVAAFGSPEAPTP